MGGLTAARAAALSVLLSLTACAGPSDQPADPAPTSSGPASSSSPSSAASTPTPRATQSSEPAIGPVPARLLPFSHRAACPVPLTDLRLLRIRYVGFDGVVRTGKLVVQEDHATGVAQVFDELYDARWPIARMRLVDAYRADDDRSMAADNTSAYNCRRVAGSADWSAHAYGAAIDLNPVENPYVRDGSVAPPSGRRFAGIDRSRGATVPRGVIKAGDVVVRAFARIGWEWGGNWSSSKDYQHFSASGR